MLWPLIYSVKEYTMITGRCLCGGIEYQYSQAITELAICHCQQCKQGQGTPFVSNAPIEAAHFTISKGEHLLKSYFSSPNKRRVFCETCGSPMFSARTDLPSTIRLRVGTISQGHIPTPSYEIYCESKSPWITMNFNVPQYLQGKTD